MNKKGSLTAGGSGMIIIIIIAVILLLFLIGGGAKTIFEIGSFVSKLPTWIWVILGIILVFRIFSKK